MTLDLASCRGKACLTLHQGGLTDEHDYQFKKNHALKILQDGDKVKATVRFRGREIAHKDLGNALLTRLEKDLVEAGTVEVRPKLEGMNMFIMFAPKKK